MSIKELDLPLNRDLFFRHMIRAFSATLEETVGVEEAEGYVSIVGGELGRWIEEQYKDAAGKDRFTPSEVAEMLVDLKARIGGEFWVISVDDDKIVLGNNNCPFGNLVEGRPSLCQMTSNVFGRIAADQFGYARVDVADAIASGAQACRVVIHLTGDGDLQSVGREYYRVEDSLLAPVD